MGNPLFILSLSLLVPLEALALSPYCSEGRSESVRARKPREARIGQHTYYIPWEKGRNGRCGRSATGLDACKFPMEDHLAGRAPFAMAAVSQEGGSAALFGGVYRMDSLQKQLSQPCVIVAAADRYGEDSDGLNKMDIVVRTRHTGEKFNQKRGHGKLVGTLEGFRNGEARSINRMPEATKK